MEKNVPFLRYSILYTSNRSITFESEGAMMNISTQNRVYVFEYTFWIVKHLDMKLGQLMHSIFLGKIWFGGLGRKPRPFSPSYRS